MSLFFDRELQQEKKRNQQIYYNLVLSYIKLYLLFRTYPVLKKYHVILPPDVNLQTGNPGKITTKVDHKNVSVSVKM